jgi:hypothetical protein
VFWLGASLPILNWLSFGLIEYAHIPARALTGAWFILLLAVAFALGAATSIRPLFRGLAVGLSLSSLVAVGQWFGWGPLVYNLPAGLLYNSAIQAVAIALVIVSLDRADWRYIPAMIPGLLLAQSRGGYLVLAVGLAGQLGWLAAVLVLLAAAAASVTVMGSSDLDRIMIWSVAWHDLQWSGHGPGSFANVLFQASDGLHYPGHVHNDYLQLVYELGIWAAPAYLIYAAVLVRTESPYWPAFAGFAAAGVFFFPLYTPVTAIMGVVLAGHILCGHYQVAVTGKRVNAAV